MIDTEAIKGKKALPPIYFLFALGLMVALHYCLPVYHWLPSPWNLAGCFPILIGLIVVLVAGAQFNRRGTTVKPFQPSSVLVTEGLFGYTRNPMYLGLAIILIGVAICLGSVTPFLVIPVFVGLISMKFIRVEEQMLEDQFGDHFLEYKARVRRWM